MVKNEDENATCGYGYISIKKIVIPNMAGCVSPHYFPPIPLPSPPPPLPSPSPSVDRRDGSGLSRDAGPYTPRTDQQVYTPPLLTHKSTRNLFLRALHAAYILVFTQPVLN